MMLVTDLSWETKLQTWDKAPCMLYSPGASVTLLDHLSCNIVATTCNNVGRFFTERHNMRVLQSSFAAEDNIYDFEQLVVEHTVIGL